MMSDEVTNNPKLFTDGPGIFCPTCGHMSGRHDTLPEAPGCTFSGTRGPCDCPGWPIPQPEDQGSEKVEQGKAYLRALNLSPSERGYLSGWLMGESMKQMNDAIIRVMGGDPSLDD